MTNKQRGNNDSIFLFFSLYDMNYFEFFWALQNTLASENDALEKQDWPSKASIPCGV